MKLDKKLEESIRSHVRSILKEIGPRVLDVGFSGYEYGPDVDEDEPAEEKKESEYTTSAQLGGADLHEIAAELGVSKERARQLVQETLPKFQDRFELDPKELESVIGQALVEYVELLKSSGELTPEDIDFLVKHSKILSEMEEFREMIQEKVDSLVRKTKARKLAKTPVRRPGENPVKKPNPFEE